MIISVMRSKLGSYGLSPNDSVLLRVEVMDFKPVGKMAGRST